MLLFGVVRQDPYRFGSRPGRKPDGPMAAIRRGRLLTLPAKTGSW